MKLIVNADDYGLTKAVNLGIIDSIKNGIVTSTTMMANGWAFDHGVELYKANPGLKVGVHLNLTWGMPVCNDLQTLVAEDGSFRHRSGLFNSPENFDGEEIRRELLAQINMVREAGIEITHLDSHHHAYKVPMVAEIVAELAKSLGLPVRPVAAVADIFVQAGVDTPEYFSQGFYDGDATEDWLLALLEEYKEKAGTLELMCHPAYIDMKLMEATAYNLKRGEEMEILCGNKVKAAIEENNIALVDYSNYK